MLCYAVRSMVHIINISNTPKSISSAYRLSIISYATICRANLSNSGKTFNLKIKVLELGLV